MKELLYIAGPISSPDPVQMLTNIRNGIEAGKKMMQQGYAVCIPHLDYSVFIVGGKSPSLEEIRENSLALMCRCDVVVLLRGWEDSKGCLAEVEEARQRGMKVVELFETWGGPVMMEVEG